ncbi:MAG: PucR family transcriptional regulator [Dorea sp.]|nr:PucR family transcriptional regulator [Dorea sp.]
MAITVRELIETQKNQFNLKILAGEKGIDYTCTWVNMVEDTTVVDFFWGNELAVTSGYLMRTEEEMLENVRTYIEKNCVGILINIGPYIRQVPQSVIDYCEEEEFPLLVMPWDKSMVEFVKESCSQITRSIINEEQLGNCVMHMVRFPEDNGENMELLQNYFHESDGFHFFAMNIIVEEVQNKKRLEQRIQLRMRTSMQHFEIPYLIFRERYYWIMVLNTGDYEVARKVADTIRTNILNRFTGSLMFTGIGEAVYKINRFNFAFQSASAARRRGTLKKEAVTDFKHMGFLKLLYTVSDDEILRNYYFEILEPLLEYEKKTKKEEVYTETLFRYLLEDGSLQRVAKSMYVHENTIYYRMNKIRDILNNPLASSEDRQPVLMAYYCGVILKIVPDYETL